MNYEAELYRAFDSDPAPVVAFLRWLVQDNGLPGGPRVLDVRCGPGRLFRPLAGLGWHVTGLEPDDAFFARALDKAGQRADAAAEADGWTLAHTLRPEKPSLFDEFGVALAADGDRLFGATQTRAQEFQPGEGIVSLYEEKDGAWHEVRRLPGGGRGAYRPDFGAAMTVEGPHLLVGAPGYHADHVTVAGQAYAYDRSADTTATALPGRDGLMRYGRRAAWPSSALPRRVPSSIAWTIPLRLPPSSPPPPTPRTRTERPSPPRRTSS